MNALKRWAVTFADPEERASARMKALPPGLAEGTYVVPFKRGSRSEYLAKIKGAGVYKRADKLEPTPVKLSELTAIQRTVNAERLKQHLDNPGLIPRGKRAAGHGGVIDAPLVIRKDGQMWLHDGNHRATAAMLRGEDSINARVVDLDTEPT
jgi:hypothetical protein